MIPLLQIKFICFYFIFCKFYMVDGVSRENCFYPTKSSHNTNSAIVSITPLSGPSVANVYASLMLERQTPPKPLIWYKPYVKRGTSLA